MINPLDIDVELNFDDPYLCFTCGESPCFNACVEIADEFLASITEG